MRFLGVVFGLAMLAACDEKGATSSPPINPSDAGAGGAIGDASAGGRLGEASGERPVGGEDDASREAGDGSGGFAVTLDGITIPLAQGWTARTPSSSMRAAEVVLPGVEGEDEASMVVFYFGAGGAGTAEANLARWRSQFSMPDGSDPSDHAEIASVDLGGRAMVVMRLDGTYIAETSPGSGERVNKENWSLVGAVVETSAGPYYVKIVGPSSAIERERSGIDAMLAGTRAR